MNINSDRVLFVGDPHLDSTTPSSRIDDYSDASISKLESLRDLCLSRDVKLVVFLGDVFNKHDQSNTYLNRILRVFKSFRDSNIECFSIVGNHDISYEKLETLDRSPLNILFNSGLLKHLDSVHLNTPSGYTVNIQGLDYPDSPIPVSDLPNPGLLNILVNHRFYEYGFNDPHNLTSDDCISLGYNVYVCGHDHMQYPTVQLGSRLIVRPGSFMRTSSHSYHLSRKITVSILYFRGTPELPHMSESTEIIPCRPSNEVFSNSVYQRDLDRDITQEMESLESRVDVLLSKMDKPSTSQNLFEVLDSLCEDPKVKQCVEIYLSVGGYQRENRLN